MSRILFLGDSITDAYHSYDTEQLGEGFVRYIAEELGLGFDADLKVTNAGQDGYTIDSLLSKWNENYSSLSSEDYDTVSVLIGANDTGILVNTGRSEDEAVQNYEEKLRTLSKALKETGIEKIIFVEPFLFPVNDICEKKLPMIRHFANTAQSLAEEYGFTYLPTQKIFDQTARRDGYDYLTEDGIHPSDQGHRLLADLWLAEYRK